MTPAMGGGALLAKARRCYPSRGWGCGGVGEGGEGGLVYWDEKNITEWMPPGGQVNALEGKQTDRMQGQKLFLAAVH